MKNPLICFVPLNLYELNIQSGKKKTGFQATNNLSFEFWCADHKNRIIVAFTNSEMRIRRIKYPKFQRAKKWRKISSFESFT